MPNARRQRILLTGSTGTLGTALTHVLCKQRAELILPVRDPQKAAILSKQLCKTDPDACLSFPTIDLSNEEQINDFALYMLNDGRPLDAIILNAGVFTKAGLSSPQGNEWHMQVNCLSQFLLTERLLPLLQRSSTPCVLAVTSLSAFWFRRCPANAGPTRLYAASKRALLERLQQLSHHHPSISFCYAHPGVCATGLFSGNRHQTAYPAWLLRMVLPIMKLIFPTPEKACMPILHALETHISGHLSEPGGFLNIWGKPVDVPLAGKLNK